MKVTFRLNKRIPRNCFEKRGNAEDWVKCLAKYLSDEATLDLAVVTNKLDNDASLLIRDKGMSWYASSNNENMADAIDTVVRDCAIQLVKSKGKKAFGRETLLSDESAISFDEIDDYVDLATSLNDGFELIEAEQALSIKKETPRYNRVINRYVDYLYGLKDIENEIESAENHLSMLYAIKDTELDTILYRDYELLLKSIEEIQERINALIYKKSSYKMNIRDEAYINEIINDELNVLNLRRKVK